MSAGAAGIKAIAGIVDLHGFTTLLFQTPGVAGRSHGAPSRDARLECNSYRELITAAGLFLRNPTGHWKRR